ncbi:MAG: hypothetical protein ABIH71_05745 [Candidatus Omnitrophota bacterium]
MSKSWKEVEQSENYKKLSSENKSLAQREYWDTVVTKKEKFQQLSPEDKVKAQVEFLGSADRQMPRQTEFEGVSAQETPEGDIAFAGPGVERVRKEGETQRGREIFRPGKQTLEQFLSPEQLAERESLIEASRGMRGAGVLGEATLSGLTSGISRALIPERAREEYQPRDVSEIALKLSGDILGGVIGAPGKIFTGTSKLLAKKLGTGSLAKIATTALSAGVTGFAQTPEEDIVGLGERGLSAGVGVATGGILEAAVQTGGAGRKFFKSLSDLIKLKKYRGLKEITKELGKIEGLQKLSLAETIDDVDLLLKENIKVIDDLLISDASKGSLRMKKLLRKAMKEQGKIYRKGLEEAEKTMLSTAPDPVTKGEMNDIYTKTINEVRELELPASKAEALITKLSEEKYGTVLFSKQFTLKETLNDVRSVRKLATFGFKKGTQRMSPEDVAISIFNKNWGQFVEKRLPDLAKANKAYAASSQFFKDAIKIFKPFKPGHDTKTGTDFLVKLGKGNLEQGQKRFVELLQKGYHGVPGVGKISSKLQPLGAKLKALESAQEPFSKVAANKILDSQKSLERLPTFLRGDLDKRIAQVKNRYQPQIARLELERAIVEQLTENAKFGKHLRNMFLNGLATYGVYEISRRGVRSVAGK